MLRTTLFRDMKKFLISNMKLVGSTKESIVLRLCRTCNKNN